MTDSRSREEGAGGAISRRRRDFRWFRGHRKVVAGSLVMAFCLSFVQVYLSVNYQNTEQWKRYVSVLSLEEQVIDYLGKKLPRLHVRRAQINSTNLTLNEFANDYMDDDFVPNQEMHKTKAKNSRNQYRSIILVDTGNSGGETMKTVLMRINRQRCNNYRKRSQQGATMITQQGPNCILNPKDGSSSSRVIPSRLSHTVRGYLSTNHFVWSPDHADATETDAKNLFRYSSPISRRSNSIQLGLDRIDPEAFYSSTSYLFNLRHPVDRVLSYYHHMSPRYCHANKNSTATRKSNAISTNCIVKNQMETDPNSWIFRFFTCFPRLKHLATLLIKRNVQAISMTKLPAADHTISTNVTTPVETLPPVNAAATSLFSLSQCYEVAQEAFTGRNISWADERQAWNLIANLRTNAERTVLAQRDKQEKGFHSKSEKEVLVVRTEHLWTDLTSLDIFLGGTGVFLAAAGETFTTQASHPSPPIIARSEFNAVRSSMPPQAYRFMCCEMMEEMAAYHFLLQKASNLDSKTKEDTLVALLEKCGEASWSGFIRRCTNRRIDYDSTLT